MAWQTPNFFYQNSNVTSIYGRFLQKRSSSRTILIYKDKIYFPFSRWKRKTEKLLEIWLFAEKIVRGKLIVDLSQ